MTAIVSDFWNTTPCRIGRLAALIARAAKAR